MGKKFFKFKKDVLFRPGNSPAVGDDGNLYLERLEGIYFE
jgi:hypothetical protein